LPNERTLLASEGLPSFPNKPSGRKVAPIVIDVNAEEPPIKIAADRRIGVLFVLALGGLITVAWTIILFWGAITLVTWLAG